MNNLEIYIAIFIMVLVNYFTRAFPFLFFSKKELPSYLIFIAKYFPAIIMSILIIYTLKDIDFKTEFYGIKEISGIFFTAILHLVFKNYLISIFVGTIFYMGLVQLL
ncbi:MAG: branched-chain amino acid transporter permease [Arcobacter sp.]|jgi:branched-subunit amino acid transport protein AzlD|uniref:branched-chain amino acid transporter permease n=1 Tax=Arcobacter sp. TaxID=1872629 RepID=UPI003D02FBD2